MELQFIPKSLGVFGNGIYKFYIFTLRLAPFASKLVNYSRHSES